VFDRNRDRDRQRDRDPCSSASLFTGWKTPPSLAPPPKLTEPFVEPATTWLLRTGWKRHGLIDLAERPSAG